MNTYAYQVENFCDVKDEFKPFIKEHHDELGILKDAAELEFDWDIYGLMEKHGKLHFVTVRRGGVLIGYHLSNIGTHPQHKNTLHAFVDFYYIKKEYRNGRVGMKLFKFVEADLQTRGVKVIYTSCRTMHDNTRLFEALGYQLSDLTFTKSI